ncbi:50S ribosomal protein L21 [Candidatus Kuenenbacteria bacterium CG_4_8_14_3_um_filter_39_15]|uniref:Large ribosomal subunit protein bL21 n=4 Tax=Candidatus Kueneniibacteriota TaxID=1752740 RepID=A0A2M7IM07_9BACT|nr:50S ribosomal protein L21 [Candidatus Kuenenbacteria bacterium]PIP75176.1 MAG: 50S ribosomal protein L21 [Candidatus Kuenenbacteria bacterium CG22_combo_CG10-13_8_21_14_all_39_9]PIR80785.1 MAG: 50S ribosomal protein L21 [Candidatus Kuenenbacteria bacterium CG10_big_fil_rev_8_21_14_0_10_39_14]PIW95834.1 MAG: 50S ribosomal protein L21 [Candidatus Kuenenbacteria bacterium CG_4_8_14_3_um_filter_39_15]PIX92343.1 MAG: 50S ribosomal protein L21 [Candidatus Kuenenbacteria bacterium CG_4_10_14_3_um_f
MNNKIAVIKTGGKQYIVQPNDKLKVEKLNAQDGAQVDFEVLMTSDQDGQSLKLGNPTLAAAKVEAKVLNQGRAEKIRVVHYKAKTRYHKVYGHRQPFTQVEILSIS